MDPVTYNRSAWDHQVESGNRWTVPVGPEEIAEARQGRWRIFLTPIKPVPDAWFPALAGADVLCLASGGGQQGPILAAAGAEIMPIEVDLDRLRTERERGLRSNLGQPLKSFRDREVDFDVYRRGSEAASYLHTLGPLVKPG